MQARWDAVRILAITASPTSLCALTAGSALARLQVCLVGRGHELEPVSRNASRQPSPTPDPESLMNNLGVSKDQMPHHQGRRVSRRANMNPIERTCDGCEHFMTFEATLIG
jgi:hypothetical protein